MLCRAVGRQHGTNLVHPRCQAGSIAKSDVRAFPDQGNDATNGFAGNRLPVTESKTVSVNPAQSTSIARRARARFARRERVLTCNRKRSEWAAEFERRVHQELSSLSMRAVPGDQGRAPRRMVE